MNHTATAIREAAERGGYGYRWWKANDIEDDEGYNALPYARADRALARPYFLESIRQGAELAGYRCLAFSLAPLHRSHCIRQGR
jgi:hypothetical protein